MRFSFVIKMLTAPVALQLFQVMRLGSAILTGILLAKSGLSTGEIGAWEMLLYLGTTVSFFWVNGLLQGMSPVYTKLDAAKRKVFLFNSFLIFCSISLVVYLTLSLGERWLAPVLTGLHAVPHYQWFCLYLLLHLPSFPVEYIYLLQRKPWRIVGWGAAIFGLHVLALWLPIVLGWGLAAGIQALVGLGALKFLWTVRLVWHAGVWTIDRALWRQYLLFCAPLMLSSVVSNVMLLFDNWLVGWQYQDPAVFAIYRYGARELPLATALVSALGTAMIPRLVAAPEEALEEVKTRSLHLMHLLFPFTLLLLACSTWLFPRVFSPAFAASAALFNIYLLTLASRVLTPAAIVLARGDSRSIFRVSLLEMVVKITLGFWFIQWWGLPGLAWSVVLAFWIEKLGLMAILEWKYKVRTSSWLDWRWYGFYSILLFAMYGWVSCR